MKQKLGWFKLLPAGLAFRLIILSLVRKIFKVPVTFSFSQGAEDIITPYLMNVKKGVYVDVGCNEPVRFSNTFNFYLQGWTGINIDANCELIEKCKRIRKKDISICAAVSNAEKEVVFHKSKTSAVSTIDENRLQEWEKLWTFDEADRQKVKTRTLTSILNDSLSPETNIDLLSIDVEGHDFEVLQGLDLAQYRPEIIIIEIHSLNQITSTNIYKYLIENDYSLRGYAILNAYFSNNKKRP
jgi:FkbM family methyltransferase